MNDLAVCPDDLFAISYCTGGLGLDTGLDLAMPSCRPVAYVEREAFAAARVVSAIEQGLVAPAPVFSDARAFPGRKFRGLVDFAFGGIPCQPHSHAGKRLGKADERDLWSSFRRGAVQSGAWAILIENVDGMVSSGGLERVWRDLLRMGAKVEAGLFRADECGAPHERSRIFILAVFEARFLACADRCGSGEVGGDLGEVRGLPHEECGSTDGSALPWRGGEQLAHADGGRQRRESDDCVTSEQHDQSCRKMGDAAGDGRGSRRPEPEGQQRIICADVDGPPLADASDDNGGRGDCGAEEGTRAPQGGRGRSSGGGIDVVNPVDQRRDWRPSQSQRGSLGRAFDEWASSGIVFPPGPGNVQRWAEILDVAPGLEPSICRLDYGLVSRVDELRLLGNGVVPIQAALAFRTLVTRLAARSRAASELLRRLVT